jgi:hypothetical protein
MAINYILPIRAVQAVLSITVLGLMSYGAPLQPKALFLFYLLSPIAVSSWWSSHWRQSSPSEVNFLIFAPSWTVLTILALVLAQLRYSHLTSSKGAQWSLLALEGLTMLFWFGGFVALAVFLSDRICFGTVCTTPPRSEDVASERRQG